MLEQQVGADLIAQMAAAMIGINATLEAAPVETVE
jgi:hypothetical protein